MNNVQREAGYEAQDQHGDTHRVELDCALQPLAAVALNEGVQSGSAQNGSLTAGSSWRITGAKHASALDVVVNDVTLVNVARVVAAGAGCCPSCDLLATNDKGQRVAGFDVIDRLPANADFGGWIGHDDTFVEDFELWSQEDQPCGAAGEGSPCQCAENLFNSSEEQKRCNGENCQCKNDSSENNSADRSVSLSITHNSIFAGGVAVLSITQQEKI